ncbi:MAG: hypothetical protein IMW98_05155 [Firmicutes bacterium]|nr:hypothetical protein [Bacillota bacterium]
MEHSLTISVEDRSPEFADFLEGRRLQYQVFKSSRRWVYRTGWLPEPVSEAAALFVQRTFLPDMLLEHLDTQYGEEPDEDRLEVFHENLAVFERPDFTRGTQALLRPTLEERGTLSIEGWMRFRGRRTFQAIVAELARAGLRALRLRRAFEQFRELRREPVRELVIEGAGPRLVVKDASGVERYREYLAGFLDPRLELGREDLALSLLHALQPERVELVDVDPDFRRKVEAWLRDRRFTFRSEAARAPEPEDARGE